MQLIVEQLSIFHWPLTMAADPEQGKTFNSTSLDQMEVGDGFAPLF
jgi:hypothetical protein